MADAKTKAAPPADVVLCADCRKVAATTTCTRPPCDGREICGSCYRCHDPAFAWKTEKGK